MKIKKNEDGYLFVESAIAYIFLAVIMVLLLYIISLCAQRAQMLAAAEQTMVYIKYVCAGNYDINDTNYDIEKGMDLPIIQGPTGIYNPYSLSTFLDTPTSRANELKPLVKKIFDHYVNIPLLGNIDKNYTVELDVQNYVIFTQVNLTVKFKMNQFLNFSYIGGEIFNNPEFTINMQGVISDNTSTMRTMQYIDYFLMTSGITEKIDKVFKDVKGWFKK